ncbi:MAG: hypothetical protein HYY96_12560 [Candidatus Tectomicrobia bacterium]|nr:hypothetical protein [Candidatus Tectomicrobia bacterium]
MAIITPSGGLGVELTDLYEAAGLQVPMLSPALQAEIAAVLPPFGSPANPIDVTPVWAQFAALYRRIIELLCRSDEVDIIVPCIVLSATRMPELIEAVRDTVLRCQREEGRSKPVVIAWGSLREYQHHQAILEEAEIPCYPWSQATAAAIAGMVRYARARRRALLQAASPA